MEDSFKLLEERVHRAAERLKALAAGERSLRAELAKEKERAGNADARARDSEGRAKEAEALARKAEALARKAEEALAAAESEGASGAGGRRAEELEDEVAVLRQEREELRARVEKLVSLLERL